MEFGKCIRVNGEAIANEIIRILIKVGLEIKNCRGQGYDGASNMPSEDVGVQGRIKTMREKAVYTHCCGHNLCLVVVAASNFPVVRSVRQSARCNQDVFLKTLKR